VWPVTSFWAARSIKCRALLWGNIGEYHFDVRSDNMLFGFKGIKAMISNRSSRPERAMMKSRNGSIAAGPPKSQEEKRVWCEEMLKANPYYDPEKRDW